MSTLGPVTLWTGWDVRGGADAQPAASEEFAHEVRQDVGVEARYELISVAGRGFRPPRFLSAVGLEDDDQVESLVRAQSDSRRLRQMWSVLYRRLAEIGSGGLSPYAIYLLGVNPPVDATEEELAVFNDFYTNVHLPEVAQRREALCATRYELLRAPKPPYPGAPKYLAVYEVNEEAASRRRHVGPPYAEGPEVWQRHTTPWRLWYRLVADDERGNP